MAEANEDLDVLIDEQAPPDADGAVVVETPDKPQIVTPEEGIETLKKQLEEQRAATAQAEQARQQADARAQRSASEAATAQGGEHDANINLVTTAIETVKQTLTMAKQQYAEAMTAQDFDAAADAQEAIADAKHKQNTLEIGLQQLKAAPKPQLQSQPILDPVEDLARQLPPRSAGWVRAHPQFARDQRLYNQMIAAHNLVQGRGVEVESDAYFAEVENLLGLQQHRQADDDASADAAQVTQRRTASISAPVTRSGTGIGGRPNSVRLSPAEREMAENMGMTAEDYARNKVALQREGKLH